MHDLPFQTITQVAGLGLTLIAGWFLGLASHSGGRKWRERLEEAETRPRRTPTPCPSPRRTARDTWTSLR